MVENGSYTQTASSNNITGNYFQCTGGTILKAPHAGVIPDSHIYLDNITDLIIGDITSSTNNFNIANYGIHANMSSFTVANNKFTHSFTGRIFPLQYAIYATGSAANTVVSTVTIGDANAANPKNIFTGWPYDIYTSGVESVTVQNNIMSDCYSGVNINRAQYTTITSNQISDYQIGIGLYNGYLYSGCLACNYENQVTDNELNTGNNYAGMLRYGYTSIDEQNRLGGMRVEIKTNHILNSAIGIHVRNVGGVRITDENTYESQIPEADIQSPHYGIWLENSSYSLVANNNVSWTGTTASLGNYLSSLKGIAIAKSNGCRIQENTITNMAAGIDVFDDCSGTNLLCNDMQYCYHGVYLDPPPYSTTSLLSTQGVLGIDPAHTTSWDNKWTNNVGPHKVDGSTWGGQLIRWVYDQSLGLSSSWSPDPSASFVILQPGDLHNGCNIPPAMDDGERSRMFGSAVGDSTQTDGWDTLEFVITDKEAFYKQAKADTSMLTRGVPSDVAFHEQYDSLRQANIGKYEAVKDSLATGNKQAALQLLAAIVDQNLIDQNKKYMSTLIALDYNPALDADSDSDTLVVVQNIAFMHPFYGGEAVYWARAMLHLDVIDVLPEMRRAHTHQQISKPVVSESKGILFPNPTNDKVAFKYQNNSTAKVTIQIHDKLGRLLENYLLKENEITFSTGNYTQGIYQVTIYENDIHKETHKLIIIK